VSFIGHHGLWRAQFFITGILVILALAALTGAGIGRAVANDLPWDPDWHQAWDDQDEGRQLDLGRISTQAMGGYILQIGAWTYRDFSDLSLQGGSSFELYVDTDRDSGTGVPIRGMGADYRLTVEYDEEYSHNYATVFVAEASGDKWGSSYARTAGEAPKGIRDLFPSAYGYPDVRYFQVDRFHLDKTSTFNFVVAARNPGGTDWAPNVGHYTADASAGPVGPSTTTTTTEPPPTTTTTEPPTTTTTVPEGYNVISGAVYDGITGELIGSDYDDPMLYFYSLDGQTIYEILGPDGLYEKVLPAGKYRVILGGLSRWGWRYSIWYPQVPGEHSQYAEVVDITSGDAESMDFYVTPERSISGSVTDADGLPLLDASVTAYDSSGRALASMRLDRTGSYSLSPLLGGKYRVRVSASFPYASEWYDDVQGGWESFDSANVVDITLGDASEVDFTLGTLSSPTTTEPPTTTTTEPPPTTTTTTLPPTTTTSTEPPTTTTTEPSPSFTDVSQSHPYGEAIESLAGEDIINGYQDNTFRPDEPVWRQHFAKMIVLALGLPCDEGDVSPFGDVTHGGQDTLYPDNYIAVAEEYGITKGTGPDTFAPYENISRAQVITMVVRAATRLVPGLLTEPPPEYQSTWGPFSPTHTPSTRIAEYNDLLIGIPLSQVEAWGDMPRGEVAQVLDNLRNQIRTQ